MTPENWLQLAQIIGNTLGFLGVCLVIIAIVEYGK